MHKIDRRFFLKTSALIGVTGWIYQPYDIVKEAQASEPESDLDITIGSPVFPLPKDEEFNSSPFRLDDRTRILLANGSNEHDLFLANILQVEFVDYHGQGIPFCYENHLPLVGNYILMGTVANPLVKEYLTYSGLQKQLGRINKEGYALYVSSDAVIVAGKDDEGAFYGLQTIRQLICSNNGALEIIGAQIYDYPKLPLRGVRMHLPGRSHFPFYKRFVRDFMCQYKMNSLVMEVNANMRLNRHPELNAGIIDENRCMKYTRRARPIGPGGQVQDGSHYVVADGDILEKEEVAYLVDYARSHHIDVIPEIPSLTHCYYLLNRHHELAEISNAEWPDTYCPSNPDLYDLLFDVYDEYLEVMRPKIVHIGHDEWRIPLNVCKRCKDKHYSELFIQDVQKIHDYLSFKGVRTAMWGDHLVESHRGKGLQQMHIKETGYNYQKPGALTHEQIIKHIPKDILIFNWSWRPEKHPGEKNTKNFQNWGFQQVYGNFSPFDRLSNCKGVIGGFPSTWSTTCEESFGKDFLYDFLGCANLVWSGQFLDDKDLILRVQSLMPDVRIHLRGIAEPSRIGEPLAPIDLGDQPDLVPISQILPINDNIFDFVNPQLARWKLKIPTLKNSNKAGAIIVRTNIKKGDTFKRQSQSIIVNKDVSSLIFLHACCFEGINNRAHFLKHNQNDSSELLGWYKIKYLDGMIESLPIRYGINILHFGWPNDQEEPNYCYRGDPVNITLQEDNSVHFVVHEWLNPRLGKIVQSVTLHGAESYLDYKNNLVKDNVILLAGMSVTISRPVPPVPEAIL